MAVGRGSWGVYLVLFVPSGGSGSVQEAPLAATSFDEATLELDALSDSDLEALLARATPKTD